MAFCTPWSVFRLNVVIAGLDPAIHLFELTHLLDGGAGQARA
jgi:hypothetical protein